MTVEALASLINNKSKSRVPHDVGLLVAWNGYLGSKLPKVADNITYTSMSVGQVAGR